MVGIYCRRKHGAGRGQLCENCAALLAYALERMERCPRGDAKTSCRKCPVHCYAPSRRSEIREVMRYVGPRMLFYHPVSAVRHLLSEL